MNIFPLIFGCLGCVVWLIAVYQFSLEKQMIGSISDLQLYVPRIAVVTFVFFQAAQFCYFAITAIDSSLTSALDALKVIADACYDLSTLGGYATIFLVVNLTVRNSYLATNIRMASSDVAEKLERLQFILIAAWGCIFAIFVAIQIAKCVTDLESYRVVFLFALSLSVIVLLSTANYNLWKLYAYLQSAIVSAGGAHPLDQIAPFLRFMAVATTLMIIAIAFQCYTALNILLLDWDSQKYFKRDQAGNFDLFSPVTLLVWCVALFYSRKTLPTEEELARARDRSSSSSVMSPTSSAKRKTNFSAATVVPIEEAAGMVAVTPSDDSSSSPSSPAAMPLLQAQSSELKEQISGSTNSNSSDPAALPRLRAQMSELEDK